jgi:DNA invertase Pin-like site-specific DNA recombinase
MQQVNSKVIRAAIYCRVSTMDQTTQNQLPDLRAYAAARAWTVENEYLDEGISGSKKARPGLDKLMSQARKRKFDVCLVWRFDRFGRSVTHLLNAMEEFRQLGIDFVSLNEAIDTSTPMGKMIFVVCSAVAELERSIIIERVHAGLKRARNQGKRLGRPKVKIDIQQVHQLSAEGFSCRIIAQRLKVSKSTVGEILKTLRDSISLPASINNPLSA